MAEQKSTVALSTWTGSKYAQAYRNPGHYEGKIIAFEKSQVNDVDWYLKLSINGKDQNKIQVQSRWQKKTDAPVEQQVKTVNALAMMLTNLMDSLGVAYDIQNDITNKSFDQLIGLIQTKALIGKEVKYEIRERTGSTGAKLQQIIFE